MLLPIKESNYKECSTQIINELELVKIYKNYGASERLANELCKYYSLDKKWITQTQNIIKNFNMSFDTCKTNEKINELLNETQSPVEFRAKYQYIELFKNAPEFQEMGDKIFNYSSLFHQIQSYLVYYNPLIIVLPHIFQLIQTISEMTVIPTFSVFIEMIIKYAFEYINNSEVTLVSKIFTVLSLIYTPTALYFSVKCIISWRNNLSLIRDNIVKINNYIIETIGRMEYWISLNYSDSYTKEVLKSKTILLNWKERTKEINDGVCLSEWYRIKMDKELNDSLHFSVDFNDYCNFIINLKSHNLGCVVFNDNGTKIENCKYQLIPSDSCITNDITTESNKPLIITGKNASGKTTILKSFFINCLLNQQIGMGSYTSCSSPIYTKFFAYINIPDTSDRYSLFQAELDNCLSIIKETNEIDNTLCIFDELLTGTNNDDANRIQYAYINYISQQPNITAVITTHNTKVCKRLKKLKIINTKQMDEITRKLTNGICYKNGGLDIIKKMNYPESIINHFRQF
jgi:energy-coupling factor transporter ATP-binding protein EcfA2